MTTSSGAVAERYSYTAYGQPTILNASGTVLTSSAVGNRYTYTGREWDATLGLHHFRARWMSPLAGRFLGRDPIGYLDTYSLYDLEIALSALDPTGNSTLGTEDVDIMFQCLQTNYTQLSIDYKNDKKKCPYVPLGILATGRYAELTNDLGVGVILISVQGILPEGLAGKITESVLAHILNQNTCNPSDTESDVKKKLVDLLTKYIKDKLKERTDDAATKKAIDIIADQLTSIAMEQCKPGNRQCRTFASSYENIFWEKVSCFLMLCKENNSGIDSYSLSGSCNYTCQPSKTCSCACGEAYSVSFRDISWTHDPSSIYNKCENFSSGNNRKL